MHATIAHMRQVADSPNAKFIYALMESEVDWESSFPVAIKKHPDEARHSEGFQDAHKETDTAQAFHGGAAWGHFGRDIMDTPRRREGVVNADVLDAPFDPSPHVLKAMGYGDADTDHASWLLRTSPPTHSEGMIAAISKARGVPEICVLCAGGSSSLMFLAIPRLVAKSSRVALLDPTYGEYRHIFQHLVGCTVDVIDCDPAAGCVADARIMEDKLVSGHYDLVVIVNPNSPTGQYIPKAELEDILKRRAPATKVWIDETYIEYAQVDALKDSAILSIGHPSTYSLETFAASETGVFVCKSMSKMYALSGARAAYLVGSASQISMLKAYNPPWSVSLIGQAAAIHALRPASMAYYLSAWADVVAERRWMEEQLRARFRGIRIVSGSCASYLLIFLPASAPTAAKVVAVCAAQGVYLRNACSMGIKMGDRAIRIAIKGRGDNLRVLRVLGDAVRTYSNL